MIEKPGHANHLRIANDNFRARRNL
jgi:hypothetical protein